MSLVYYAGSEVRDTFVGPTSVTEVGKEERGIVRFLIAQGVGGPEIHRSLNGG